MQYCPLDFSSNSNNNKIIIEHFDSETNDDTCIASLVPVDKADVDDETSYLSQRNKNLKTLDNRYNQELTDYLNTYNTYLLNRSMLKNSPPGSATQSQLAVATDKAKADFLNSKKKIKKIQEDLEKDNKKTNDIISNQSEHITNKTNKINLKNSQIIEQSKLIEDKTKLLNSRTRQIELGISQNNYKKNIMWMLIIINIIFVCAICGFFIFNNKS